MNVRDLIYDRLESSISEFCRDTKISRVTIWKILKVENYKPRRDIVIKICKYLGVDYHDYL